MNNQWSEQEMEIEGKTSGISQLNGNPGGRGETCWFIGELKGRVTRRLETIRKLEFSNSFQYI